MKHLKAHLINLAILILLSACVFGRDVAVNMTVSRPPEVQVGDDPVLVLPLLMKTSDFNVEKDLNAHYLNVIKENPLGINVVTSLLPEHKHRRDVEDYFDNGKIELSEYGSYKAKYILLHYIIVDISYYSDYSGIDGLNPSYSAESTSYPGMYETPSEWKKRSFEDYIYKVDSHFVMFDISTGERVLDKNIENSYILEDYRYKDLNMETLRIVYLLTAVNTDMALSYFRNRDEKIKRIFLR